MLPDDATALLFWVQTERLCSFDVTACFPVVLAASYGDSADNGFVRAIKSACYKQLPELPSFPVLATVSNEYSTSILLVSGNHCCNQDSFIQ